MKAKIALIGKFFPPAKGGIESHLMALCDGLKKDVELTVLVANDKARTEYIERENMRIIKAFNIFTVNSTPLCPTISGILKHLNSDLLHLHVPNPLFMYFVSRQKTGRKLVISWHSDIIRQKRLKKLFHTNTLKMLRSAHGIIVPTRNHITASEYLPEFQDKCTVIPYGIDVKKFEINLAKQGIMAEVRNRIGGPLVLFVGRLVAYKGLDVLIRAISELDCGLIIVGDGPLKNQLIRLAHKLGLGNRIWISDNVSDEELPSYYHACDIFCLPSVGMNEGFGIVQLEAMASGKPVIATRLRTGVSTVTRDGQTGLLVEPNNIFKMREAVQQLIQNPELAKSMGQNGLQRVKTHYDIRITLAETLNFYRQILEG